MSHPLKRTLEDLALSPDFGRGMRVAIALGVPLVIFHELHWPAEAVFIAMASQALAVPDLRGSYSVRLAILGVLIIVASASAWLGVCVGGSWWASIIAMGVLALMGGAWRMLSEDYGPSLSVNAVLLFLIGTGHPGTPAAAFHLAGLIATGGCGAALLQIASWLFRPQHSLRYAVAECWVAASDLVATMRGNLADTTARQKAVTAAEQTLRATLNQTTTILVAAENRHRKAFVAHLEEMRVEAVHFVMRILALETALEAFSDQHRPLGLMPTIDSVLKTLGDAARSTAVTLISHRPANFTATEVRLLRSANLIRVLDEQLAAHEPGLEIAQIRAALESTRQELKRMQTALAKTIDHGTVHSRLSVMLPEISTRSVRSLAAWIDPEPQFDPVLVRYALRTAVLTMIAVGIYKWFAIPNGYWMAFTIMVVLQPDYGSTRQKAAERIGGTLIGSLFASGLLWLKVPFLVLDGFTAAAAFGFAYFQKRRYDIAVIFVTVMVVLMTEITTTVHLSFTITRLLCNLCGGIMALIAAVFFWPVWEGKKFTTLLATAIQTNRTYLRAIGACLAKDSSVNLLLEKKRAENANRIASASLQRMLAEPGEHRENDRCAAALATGNQRITRAFTALALPVQEGTVTDFPNGMETMQTIGVILEDLSSVVQPEVAGSGVAALETRVRDLEHRLARQLTETPASDFPPRLAITHLAKSVAEIRAMILTLNAASDVPEVAGE